MGMQRHQNLCDRGLVKSRVELELLEVLAQFLLPWAPVPVEHSRRPGFLLPHLLRAVLDESAAGFVLDGVTPKEVFVLGNHVLGCYVHGASLCWNRCSELVCVFELAPVRARGANNIATRQMTCMTVDGRF
jgi:hypothetical protein